MAGVRLQDVAELAGVSMKTVSNVVHEYPHVSDRMRERVQKAIDELGYRPNLLGDGSPPDAPDCSPWRSPT